MKHFIGFLTAAIILNSCGKEKIENPAVSCQSQEVTQEQPLLRTGPHGRIGCVVEDNNGHPIGGGTKCINIQGECADNTAFEKHTESLGKDWHGLTQQQAEVYAIDYADQLRNEGKVTTQAQWNEVKAVYKAYLLTL